jgi:iron complex outermembrane recepter protein
MMNRLIARLAGACFAISLLDAAIAQEAAQSAATAGTSLEEIIVTAQKRDQSLHDVPISISVTNSETLTNFQVRDAGDVQSFVPGMVLERAPDDGLGVTFRGIGSPPRNQSFENSVGMFVDGIFMGQSRLYFGAFFDLDQVEFVKGTQSTLLGKNTSLGAITISTRHAGQAFGADFIGAGDVANGGGSFEGGLDLPLTSDFKVRVAALGTDLHGGFRNSANGDHLPVDQNLGLRLTADWRINDSVNSTMLYQYFRDLHIGSGNQVVLDPHDVIPILGPSHGVSDNRANTEVSLYTAQGLHGESFKNTHGHLATAIFNVDVGSHTLTSQSSFVRYGMHNVDDFDFEAVDHSNFLRTETYYQITQELRVASPTGRRFEYLAGLFYLYSNWKSSEDQQWGIPGYPPAPAPISGQLFNGEFLTDFRQKTSSYSGFVNGTLHFTDRFRSTVGLRYTDENKNIVFGRTALAPFTIWNQAANPPFAPAQLYFDDSFLNGNVNFQYEVTRDLMSYLSFANGTKTGGYADGVTIASGDPEEARIKSESANTYEAGAKWTLLGGSAQIDSALFLTKVQNFQETEFNGTAFLTKNIPLQSKGVDFSSRWQAMKGLQLSLGFVYTDALDLATHLEPSAAPHWSANLGWLYKHGVAVASAPLEITFAGSIHYRGPQYEQIEESIPRTPQLTTVDLNLGLGTLHDRWKISVIARNVFNQLSPQFSYPALDPFLSDKGVIFGEPNPPRSVLLQLQGKL